MSIQWISHYWSNGPLDCKHRYVLIAIADNANDDGFAWPSIPLIVKKTRISESTVKRIIGVLERDGWLDKQLRGGVKKKGDRFTPNGYHLHRTPKPKSTRVQNDPPSDDPRGFKVDPTRVQNEVHEGSKSSAPLIVLTVNEPSGTLKAHTDTLSGDTGEKGERVSDPVRDLPQNPPPKPEPPPPPPKSRTLVDLLVCASPWAVLRSMRVGDVLPEHRIPVIEAYKHEARESGISQSEALEGLLRVVEAQVSNMPRDQLRFLGDIKTYFQKKNYRIEPMAITGGSNGKSKGERTTNAARAALAIIASRSGNGSLETVSASGRGTIAGEIASDRRRLM